jgi:hypothetical protein
MVFFTMAMHHTFINLKNQLFHVPNGMAPSSAFLGFSIGLQATQGSCFLGATDCWSGWEWQDTAQEREPGLAESGTQDGSGELLPPKPHSGTFCTEQGREPGAQVGGE